MYKRLDLTKLEGLGFTQDTLDFMQASYRDAIGALASFLGPLVIVTGVADNGTSWGDGWVAINGELLPFAGGLKASRIVIEETVAQEEFADESNKDVYYTRVAKLGSSGGNAFTDFVRLTTIKDILTLIGTKANSIHTHSAADIISGILNVARIPDLDAAKIITGTFPTARFADNSVTLAKIADIATGKLLGRLTAGTGDPEQIDPNSQSFRSILGSGLSGVSLARAEQFMNGNGEWISPGSIINYDDLFSDYSKLDNLSVYGKNFFGLFTFVSMKFSVIATVADNTTIATIASAHRPNSTMYVSAVSVSSSDDNKVGLEIQSGGNVIIRGLEDSNDTFYATFIIF